MSSETEVAKVTSLWLKPSRYNKLSKIKHDLDITWDELIDVISDKIIESGVLTEQTTKELREIDKTHGRITPLPVIDLPHLTANPWPQNSQLLEKIHEESQRIRVATEELIDTLDQHLETIVDTTS
jgi:hypothetical protein